MFDKTNKSKMTFEKYMEIKGKTITRSYTDRFKWVDKFMYAFSWFGNGVSIFLAFFFLQYLFFASFATIGQSIWITLGIIFFLTLFELLKRYVFSMFSLELIKQKGKLFRKTMLSFLIGTGILIVGSFYFSLNGAKEFVDNQDFFETTTEQVITSKQDSVTNVFASKKFIFENENGTLRVVNAGLRDKLLNTPDTYRTIRSGYQSNIDKNMELIKENQERVDNINAEMEIELEKLRSKEETILTSKIDDNQSNKISFLIISAIIEIIIMLGIYYDKFYDYQTIKEYEESVVNTTEFKTWYKYNYLIELVYKSTKEVGEKIPTTGYLMELSKYSKTPITKGELDKFIKLLYFLGVIVKDGNKRILNITELKGKSILRSHFNII